MFDEKRLFSAPFLSYDYEYELTSPRRLFLCYLRLSVHLLNVCKK